MSFIEKVAKAITDIEDNSENIFVSDNRKPMTPLSEAGPKATKSFLLAFIRRLDDA